VAIEKADYPPVRKPPAPPKTVEPQAMTPFEEKLGEIKKLVEFYKSEFGAEWRYVWRDTVKVNL
jgi:hypothetical protein